MPRERHDLFHLFCRHARGNALSCFLRLEAKWTSRKGTDPPNLFLQTSVFISYKMFYLTYLLFTHMGGLKKYIFEKSLQDNSVLLVASCPGRILLNRNTLVWYGLSGNPCTHMHGLGGFMEGNNIVLQVTLFSPFLPLKIKNEQKRPPYMSPFVSPKVK